MRSNYGRKSAEDRAFEEGYRLGLKESKNKVNRHKLYEANTKSLTVQMTKDPETSTKIAEDITKWFKNNLQTLLAKGHPREHFNDFDYNGGYDTYTIYISSEIKDLELYRIKDMYALAVANYYGEDPDDYGMHDPGNFDFTFVVDLRLTSSYNDGKNPVDVAKEKKLWKSCEIDKIQGGFLPIPENRVIGGVYVEGSEPTDAEFYDWMLSTYFSQNRNPYDDMATTIINEVGVIEEFTTPFTINVLKAFEGG